MPCQLQIDLNHPRRSIGYLSGPMSAPSALERNSFRLEAQRLSNHLWEHGILHYCPHANGPSIDCTDIDYETWLTWDLELLRRFDWILMAPGWAKSRGCRREFNVAMALGIPVAFALEEAIRLSKNRDRELNGDNR